MLESFKAVLETEREAEKIIHEAKEQAEKIRKNAQEKAEAVYRETYQNTIAEARAWAAPKGAFLESVKAHPLVEVPLADRSLGEAS